MSKSTHNNADARTAIYLRVSSRTQNTESQEADLKRWQAANAPDAAWYHDTFTGRTTDRPGWSKVEADIAVGRIKTVAIWRLDRLGRDVAGVSAILKDFRRRKINLVSLKDGLDLSTPAGTLMANVLASMAQFETEIRAERVAAGIAAAKARGVKWKGAKKGRLWKSTADKADAVRTLKAAGKSISAIAKSQGLSRPTIYRLLKESSNDSHRNNHARKPAKPRRPE